MSRKRSFVEEEEEDEEEEGDIKLEGVTPKRQIVFGRSPGKRQQDPVPRNLLRSTGGILTHPKAANHWERETVHQQRDEVMKNLGSLTIDASELRSRDFERQPYPAPYFYPSVVDAAGKEDQALLNKGAEEIRNYVKNFEDPRDRLEYGVFSRFDGVGTHPVVQYKDGDIAVENVEVRYRRPEDEQYFACTGLRNYISFLEMVSYVDPSLAYSLILFPSLLPSAVHLSVESDDESRWIPTSQTLQSVGSSFQDTPFLPNITNFHNQDATVTWERKLLNQQEENQKERMIQVGTALFGFRSREIVEGMREIVTILPNLSQMLSEKEKEIFRQDCVTAKDSQ